MAILDINSKHCLQQEKRVRNGASAVKQECTEGDVDLEAN